ncbi:MAG: glycerophosphodiester phosphodiesterase family protein [Cyclobacteriaceae bacterium]
MRLTLLLLISFIVSCESKKPLWTVNETKIWLDLQGHRGARGLAPENSLPGFLKALSYNVTTLEMDLAVTKDGQLVVSHEPWFSHLFCKDSFGNPIAEDSARDFNIYQMTYAEVSRFDCGSIQNPRFPEQELVSSPKPLLTEIVGGIEQYLEKTGKFAVRYNIEIKSQPEGDDIFHPSPNEFSDLVYKTIDGRIDWNRVSIQSFDFRVLQYFNEKYPEVKLAALVENQNGLDANLEALGFTPEIYSCYYKLLDRETVKQIHEKGMLVIPWTVNEIAEMEQLYDWGVDGIITDYPDRIWQSQIPPNKIIEPVP